MAVVLTVDELAVMLRLPKPTVHRLSSMRELPGVRMGESWQFDMEEICDLLENIMNDSPLNCDGRVSTVSRRFLEGDRRGLRGTIG